MSDDKGTFDDFVRALGQQMEVPLDPGPGLIRLDLNGVPFMIAYDPVQWGEDGVLMACDFGEIPQEDRCAILESILAANRDLHGLHSPVFAIDVDSGHLLSMSVLPLEGLDPSQTMLTMMKHVAVVDCWEKTHFLSTEPS